MDDLPAAVEVAREVIDLYATRDSEDYQLANTIEHLALVYALRGDFARADTMEGYAVAAFRKIGFDRELTERRTHDRLTALLREGLAPIELARLTAEGAALKPEAAAALALEGMVATKPSRPEGSS